MKYTITPPWRIDETRDIDGVILVLENADLTDERGRVHQDGAWRVKVDGKVRKTFKGETAWSDSLRLYGDVRYEILRKGL